MITCLLTLGLSTGVYADDDDGFEGFKGGSLYSHRGGRGGGDDDDDDDDDGGDPRDDDDDYYECGPKCKESTQIVLKGRIPCICDISLPSATEIRLFRARQLSRGGNIDDVEIGNFSASCNTGSVYLKLTSQNVL
ncbi:hypothetical protein JCM19231_5706 [Vibrio ishigakensis]|uniref:Uncharacterized protein n=1 Tax=Vibrio ishigakensis TaxID=1481914 RepID=A0A0B8P816_9VIBR|nr:hypothetical protein JCM19231_5706 [Vibrio ishigakensis]